MRLVATKLIINLLFVQVRLMEHVLIFALIKVIKEVTYIYNVDHFAKQHLVVLINYSAPELFLLRRLLLHHFTGLA